MDKPLVRQGTDVAIRPYRLSDVDDVLRYAGCEAVTEHTTWPAQDLEGVTSYISEAVDTPASLDRAIVWNRTDTVIGGVHLWKTADAAVAEMGYVVNPAYAGLGVATKVAHWCVEFAFCQWNCELVWGRCRPENGASARVLEKLGMTLLETIPDDVVVRGIKRSSLLFGITRSDWLATAATSAECS